MKRISYIILCTAIAAAGCKKNIDRYPESNLTTETYYNNLEEVKAGLTGAYAGLSEPLLTEWQMTELRSDNSKQGETGSTSTTNQDLNELDMFAVNSAHTGVLSYWNASYANIRNANVILQKLGVRYDAAAGKTNFVDISIPITAADRKQLAGEALFIRAYHYFNLVRLYGGVFIVSNVLSPGTALGMNRSSVADTYKFIEADLQAAIGSMNTLKYNQVATADLGRATGWAAKGLLAKVYLTQNKKAEAIPLLQDVKDNSGYKLQPTYAGVFSIASEVNDEILFTIRYKAGGLGLGSPFANMFAPLNSGTAVVIGPSLGLNFPTAELDTLTNGDTRKATLIGTYTPGASTSTKLYVKKYMSPVTIANDAENDWPVLRYADILLMLAEAQGFSASSLNLISQTRARGGLSALDPAVVNTVALFEKALAEERRVEFAFENQRWFDLVRYNTTLSTVTAEQTMKDHFAKEYYAHYRLFPNPTPTLASLQQNVTRDRLLLPIPQREININTQVVIQQNPGY
jgi:starch-binding outer membrane protein, SusD/RagB family